MRRAMIGAGCLLVLWCVPGAGRAEPPGASATTLAQGTTTDPVSIRIDGPAEFVVRTITIRPGGSTGWHYHPGRLVAVVASGTLTRYESDCSARAYRAGQALVEPNGAGEVHLGRNLGAVPVVLYATYLNPAGRPLAVAAPDPGCRPRPPYS
ncbi:cupin domain-containing protein [Actinomadura scrupuli]|uniref:cupin domain-containing protein n=1 Tax=Actinomadura scrupuli TaxID=559629 RepID=UPI003D97743A